MNITFCTLHKNFTVVVYKIYPFWGPWWWRSTLFQKFRCLWRQKSQTFWPLLEKLFPFSKVFAQKNLCSKEPNFPAPGLHKFLAASKQMVSYITRGTHPWVEKLIKQQKNINVFRPCFKRLLQKCFHRYSYISYRTLSNNSLGSFSLGVAFSLACMFYFIFNQMFNVT